MDCKTSNRCGLGGRLSPSINGSARSQSLVLLDGLPGLEDVNFDVAALQQLQGLRAGLQPLVDPSGEDDDLCSLLEDLFEVAEEAATLG